ncbi:MAG TPA: hypothetical protein VMK12_12675, partial [Anaeromyxobacteraceae bacterium]|nr:hypothetical protein [Anaeromyxobacteraceae bacterium]
GFPVAIPVKRQYGAVPNPGRGGLGTIGELAGGIEDGDGVAAGCGLRSLEPHRGLSGERPRLAQGLTSFSA